MYLAKSWNDQKGRFFCSIFIVETNVIFLLQLERNDCRLYLALGICQKNNDPTELAIVLRPLIWSFCDQRNMINRPNQPTIIVGKELKGDNFGPDYKY